MRLTDYELSVIQKTFRECFSSKDHLWLFGSRTDDSKRGGDIDLYIESEDTEVDKAIDKKLLLGVKLWELLGEQKIDIVLNLVTKNEDTPIFRMAKETGIKIVKPA